MQEKYSAFAKKQNWTAKPLKQCVGNSVMLVSHQKLQNSLSVPTRELSRRANEDRVKTPCVKDKKFPLKMPIKYQTAKFITGDGLISHDSQIFPVVTRTRCETFVHRETSSNGSDIFRCRASPPRTEGGVNPNKETLNNTNAVLDSAQGAQVSLPGSAFAHPEGSQSKNYEQECEYASLGDTQATKGINCRCICLFFCSTCLRREARIISLWCTAAQI